MTNFLVMVDVCAKCFDNWSKGGEAMLQKQIFHLNLACDLDLVYTELNHLHIIIS